MTIGARARGARRRWGRGVASGVVVGCVLIVGGCSSYTGEGRVLSATMRGEFGVARAAAQARLEEDPSSRSYILDRMKVLTLSLAEGRPEDAGPVADVLYESLRTQGLNADRTLATLLAGEGAARIYKGEPFEQAMAYVQIGLRDAMEGDWGNARAAASDSLFLLKDFSGVLERRLAANASDVEQKEALIAASVEAERSGRGGERGGGGDASSLGLETGVRPSDFELGYVIKAIAARQVGNMEEAREALAQLVLVSPRLEGLARQIEGGSYNAVLVVDVGLAPQKVATGQDGVIAGFSPRTRSVEGPLLVRVGDGEPTRWPVVTDVNRLSRDVAWNNLEDLRRARSVIGDAMVVGGAVVAGTTRDDEARLAGLGVALAGLALKATAKVDTRHCEVLPQRTYVVPMMLPTDGVSVLIGPEDAPGVRLPLVRPSARPEELRLVYVRVPVVSSPWLMGGEVRYSNDATGPVAGPQWPFILGGRCVRVPSDEVLASYRAWGFPPEIRLEDLIDLYREEGIDVQGMGVPGTLEGGLGRHVLEGGRSMATPRPDSVGFLRLFGQEHPAYRARSARVRELAATLRVQEASSAGGDGDATGE